MDMEAMRALHPGTTWITYPKPPKEETHVDDYDWTCPPGREGMYLPIEDQGGVALFRRRFTVHSVKKAILSSTALGVYELFCNGHRVGYRDPEGNTVYDEMKPGWTEYRKRVLYFTYDLTPYLQEGENILICAVAPGWYDGRICYKRYGETHVSFLATLYLTDAEGTRQIATDPSWEGAWGGAVRASDIWDGERYDARFPSPCALSRGDTGIMWREIVTETYPIAVTPHIGPTVMVRQGLTRHPETTVIYHGTEDNGTDYGRIHVVRRLAYPYADTFSLGRGETAVIDVGQNMVGVPDFRIKGDAGVTVLVRFGEMLNDSGSAERGNDNPEGSVYTVNYRSAKAKLMYTLRGDPLGESYRPLFTFYGFRYLEITADGDITLSALTCPVIGSATRETGHIETSDPRVNRLISNILWGQRGNYLSVPTDCPQRDERLGWTGDTQAFCGTAAYNADVSGFFHKWMQDARDSQDPSGMYPDVIPHVSVVPMGGAAWSDAGIIVPYTVWRMYGDVPLIEEHYDSMECYMAWLATTNHRGANLHYGDWLAYEPTDKSLISVSYYAIDALYMEAMCRALGKEDRARHFAEVFDAQKAHFQSTYCNEAGALLPEHRTQCGYLMGLWANLFSEAYRPHAIAALKQKIIDNGYRLSTGFVGSCILCRVLAECGENDLAYSLLLQREDPSWLYSVDQGATTIWERWNSYTKARGFGDVSMNSFNHYAYGAVGEWMYRHMAGIETTQKAPGFAHPLLCPKPDTRAPEDIPAGQHRLTWVKASFDAPVGKITSHWDTSHGFVYTCTVPVAATLHLPVLTDMQTYTVNGETASFASSPRTADGRAVILSLAPGTYTFIQE